jgi:hypothetical protein
LVREWWGDQYIAPAYNCPYTGELASVAYIAFTRRIRLVAGQIKAELENDPSCWKEWLSKKTLLKRIDEYNYMKFTVPKLNSSAKQKAARAGGR